MMERWEMLRLIRRICQTIEDNKDFLDELDVGTGKGNLGTRLAWSLQRIHSVAHNSTNINKVLDECGQIMISSREPVCGFYGNIIRSYLQGVEEINSLQNLFLIGLIKKIIVMIEKDKKSSCLTHHLPIWQTLLNAIETGLNENLHTGEILKNALRDIQWKLPKTANRAVTLARLLIIRSLILEL